MVSSWVAAAIADEIAFLTFYSEIFCSYNSVFADFLVPLQTNSENELYNIIKFYEFHFVNYRLADGYYIGGGSLRCG